ncbi:Las1-like-domain-containing protein [Kalaharituber pfeilii]|nr:Las1-like-domain-containing protein [Kalaharituber pfeilii]
MLQSVPSMAFERPDIQLRARIVPWRTLSDLLWVKNAFYPGLDAPDQRYEALNMVRVWSVRGRLPHSIEATAMLTEAILHDRFGASQLNLQLTYSTAICRFVNGLLDPAQQSHYAISMHTLAKNLNLPASFVEIRHAATHEILPSLAVLRTAASRGLDWIWSNYWMWVGVSPNDSIGNEDEPRNVHLFRARLLLKQWRKLRKEIPTREIKEQDISPENRALLTVIKECAAMCSTPEGMDGVIDAFLEEKALIPNGKRKTTSLMKGAFLLWLPLLEPLDIAVPDFTEQLIASMLEILKCASFDQSLNTLKSSSTISVQSPSSAPGQNLVDREFNRAILAWIKHLTSSSSRLGNNISLTNDEDKPYLNWLAKECLLNPNEWTIAFLEHILKTHPALEPKYSSITAVAKTQVLPTETSLLAQPGISRERPIQEIEDELSTFEDRLKSMKQHMDDFMQGKIDQKDQVTLDHTKDHCTRLTGKWKSWDGVWMPKPIGVL